jgi:predicted site-specific integrase-resolvase
MQVQHLNQAAVAHRLNISHRTLERWRWTGQGPRFLKIGGRVVYRIEDIETYEAERLRNSTVQPETREQKGAR